MSGTMCARCGCAGQELTNRVCDWCLQSAPQDSAPVGPEPDPEYRLHRTIWDQHPRTSERAVPETDPAQLVAVAQRIGPDWLVALMLEGRVLGWMTPTEARQMGADLYQTARLCDGGHPAMVPAA